MQKLAKYGWLFFLILLMGPVPGWPQSPGPQIFFTDLESGPNSGGQNNNGAFITIYGKRFGAAPRDSKVTVGGGAVDNCPVWTDTKITCQLGPRAQTGSLLLTVGGAISNAVPFTVRRGRIFFVAPSGSDSNNGSFASPWKTLLRARDSSKAGDIIYAMDGVTQATNDGSGWHTSMLMRNGGTPNAPIALVAYAGATVTLGSTSGAGDLLYGLRATQGGDAWVIAGLRMLGNTSGLDTGGNNWRVVGNVISCPNGDGPTGCVSFSRVSNIKFLGNEITGTAVAGSSKQYHALYFTTDVNHVEAAWNHIHNNGTCRALQFHSSPLGGSSGQNQYDLSVHDNLIHGDACDGINFATINPSQGKVEAYNNVIYDVGRGPVPSDGDADYACIYFAGSTNNGPAGRGAVHIYNNTFYDCGRRGNSDSGFISIRTAGSLSFELKNNIFYSVSSEPYFTADSDTSTVTGSNNLFFGAGPGPSFLAGNLSGDPKFANLEATNFRLLPGSPAIDAGVNTGIATDFDGVLRPQGSGFDLGAFEFSGGSAAAQPNPPTNLRVLAAK